MSDQKIRIGTSIPSLKDKIQVDITGPTDAIYWYIKFNIPLDEDSVSEKTMEVTDTEGYIMRTFINYDNEKNMIRISPIDSYEQDKYYLLSISQKVKSQKGQNLKSKIYILFKLIGNQISEFKVLKSNVKVPKPKPRPKDYELKFSKTKVYSFDNSIIENVAQDRLPMADLKLNMYIGLIGLVLTLGSFMLKNITITVACAVISIIGVLHIVYQLTRDEKKSILIYDIGAMQFNRGKYEKADKSFKKALINDPDNELAEYASNKVSFYKG